MKYFTIRKVNYIITNYLYFTYFNLYKIIIMIIILVFKLNYHFNLAKNYIIMFLYIISLQILN